MPSANPPIIAHHLILTGYGHWLPNDPRGSGSSEVRQQKLEDLGPMHFGRKPIQPAREVLRTFQKQAKPRLAHEVLWFDAEQRQIVGDAVAGLVRRRKYTVYACAVLKNHFHLCVRKHRDSAKTMLDLLAATTFDQLREVGDLPEGHPLWANRPYKRFLYEPHDVWRVIEYIEKNPVKEGLPEQRWPFVVEYDNWPFHRRAK